MHKGMSSELQAIMQRRLAKSEETPGDEQKHDERKLISPSETTKLRSKSASPLTSTFSPTVKRTSPNSLKNDSGSIDNNDNIRKSPSDNTKFFQSLALRKNHSSHSNEDSPFDERESGTAKNTIGISPGGLRMSPYLKRITSQDDLGEEKDDDESKFFDAKSTKSISSNGSKRFSPTDTMKQQLRQSSQSNNLEYGIKQNQQLQNDQEGYTLTAENLASLSSSSSSSKEKSPGFILSHVTAMKKLFTKTSQNQTSPSPSPPPRPRPRSTSATPTTKPPLVSSVKRNMSPSNLLTSIISNEKNKKGDESIASSSSIVENSSSSMSKEGDEISFDDLDVHAKNDDSIDKTEEEGNATKNDVIDNNDIESITTFNSITDWPDMTTTITAFGNNNTKEKEGEKIASSFFESTMDWTDKVQSSTQTNQNEKDSFKFVSNFDESFNTDSVWNKANPFSSMDFIQEENFGSFMEEEKLKDHSKDTSTEDDFEEEPEINEDCLHDDIILESYPITKLSKPEIGMVTNPLTNNLVICRQRDDNQWFIDEINPHTSAVVASTQISIPSIRQKITASTTWSSGAIICGIDDVLKLAVGVHRQNNRVRVRVALILNLILFGDDDSNNILSVVAVWQWGYTASGSRILLQNVMLTPPKDCFEPKSLCLADGLVFLAGTSIITSTMAENNLVTTPTVYVARPHSRDDWTINKVNTPTLDTISEATKVVHMSVAPYTHRNFKLLVVALDDGSLNIWTFEKAVVTNPSKRFSNIETQELQLFCQLEGSSCFDQAEPTIFKVDSVEMEKKISLNDDIENYCNYCAWIDSCSSTSSSILFAAAFSCGVAIYNVSREQNGAILKPMMVVKSGQLSRSFKVAWIRLSKYAPCLAILCSNSTGSFMTYGILGFRCWVGENVSFDQDDFYPICEEKLSISNCIPWTDMHLVDDFKPVVSCDNGEVTIIVPRSRLDCGPQGRQLHPSISFLNQPVASQALGVTSLGFVDENTNDNTIFLHTQLCWDSSQSNLAVPSLRQWLCLTHIGDTKNLSNNTQIEHQNESISTGGSKIEVLCQLTSRIHSNVLISPKRIARSYTSTYCAVLFAPTLNQQEKSNTISIGSDPVTFCVIQHDVEHCRISQHIDGRDVIFVDVPNHSVPKAIVLDIDGKHLKEMTLAGGTPETLRKVRLFQRESTHDEKLNIHRLFVLSSGGLLFLMSRKVDSRQLLFLGGSFNRIFSNDGILADSKCCKLWLQENEKMISFCELPSSGSMKKNFVISTTFRILIICYEINLDIVAKYEIDSPCTSLAPLGSSCVSFIDRKSNNQEIKYLSCFNGNQRVGTITSLSPSISRFPNLLVAIRPDRVIYTSIHTECDHYKDCTVRIPITKPVFILEPLIANIFGEMHCKASEKRKDALTALEFLIGRFGIKMNTNPYNEKEGIGTKGVGFTSVIFQILRETGYSDFILKYLNEGTDLIPWVTAAEKTSEVDDCGNIMRAIVDGDELLLKYLKKADANKLCVLPKPLDSINQILSSVSAKALTENKTENAIKAMDLLGSTSSHQNLAALLRTMQLSPTKEFNHVPLSKLDSCPLDCSDPIIPEEEEAKYDCSIKSTRIFSQLLPQYQSGICQTRRANNRLIEYSYIQNTEERLYDSNNVSIKDDTKHLWNCGPFNKKEELLTLDTVEEWLGRCHPNILGVEGVEIAAESGQMTLQNILAAAGATQVESPNSKKDDDSHCSSLQGWVENVGEGLMEEDKLSLYLRFFEGTDTDFKWQEDGFYDLSAFQNAVKFINPRVAHLEATTSHVDEGESGTTRLLHDLVWNDNISEIESSGLFLEVKRGNSLDIGMFHNQVNQSRQQATLEFWYYLPHRPEEVVLVRRSLYIQNGEDIESLCCKSDIKNMIWELVVLPSGHLEFRCCGGDSINTLSVVNHETHHETSKAIAGDSSDDEEDIGLASWARKDGYGGWNHVSITFSCREMEENRCNIRIAMRGIEIASSIVKFQLPSSSLEQGELLDIDDVLRMSALMFGVGAMAGFRLTELRIWAYARPIDDLKRMMYEYLDAAQIKKKRFKMSIRGKDATNKSQRSVFKKLAAPDEHDRSRTRKIDVNENEECNLHIDEAFANFDLTFDNIVNAVDEEHHDQFDGKTSTSSSMLDIIDKDAVLPKISEVEHKNANPQLSSKEPIVFESCLFSEDVKKSAASALIRGGPATRHFGGNRGGLPEEKVKVGSIAICGAQKTVIISNSQSPRGKTYPIGASGAIVSDLMEIGEVPEANQEFLCCFLAKDKRMVVFELKSEKVIVELQMTTKLNFWRFLPPSANGHTLVFLLITPVGGFHWLPLAESPHPRQVWKRGPELQGKKILSYEEGGSNGLDGQKRHSTVALLLSCSSTVAEPVEAWYITLLNDESPYCISTDVLGAALFCTPTMLNSKESFNPLVVLVTANLKTNGIALELFDFANGRSQKIIQVNLDLSNENELYEIPMMAMGPLPSVLCLCQGKFVVVIVRDRGLLMYYEFSGSSLSLVLKHYFGRYVVDAAIQTSGGDSSLDVVALVCENDAKDGRTVKLPLR